MRFIFCYFLFFSTSIVSAQLFDNSQGIAYGDFPNFNREFIRLNAIKSIKGNYTYKRQGEVMKATTYSYVYAFDTLGRLTSTVETRQDDGTKDSVWTWYYYDEHHNLMELKKGNYASSSFTRYTYDEVGRKSSITKGQYFIEGGKIQQVVFGTETLAYEGTKHQSLIRYFNSYNLPYKEETTTYDRSGYLIQKEQRYLMTSETLSERFTYDGKGLVAERTVIESGKETPVERVEFTYDGNNQLTEQRIHRNGIYTTEIEFLYNEKSQLLTYILTRDVATNYMIILNITEIRRY